MTVSSQEPSQENTTDRFPLLMDPMVNRENNEHIIDMERVDTSSSDNDSTQGLTLPHHEDRESNSSVFPVTQFPSSLSNGSDSRASPHMRRGEGLGRRRWSPFNNTVWISVEFIFTIGQIIAAAVVVSVSKHEDPQTPLLAWILGYAAGCVASLPLLYWRFIHRNRGIEQGLTQPHQGSSQGNPIIEPNSYITISLTRSSAEEDGGNPSAGTWSAQTNEASTSRLNVLMDHFKMALDCFFAVWFVVGNVWVFGGNSSSAAAPNLYRLCIVFLTFSCIGYGMPFILCAMICCCFPCIISILGAREDMNGTRGATEESINALPRHRFKLKRNDSDDHMDGNALKDDGGFIAAGTDKEHAFSGEDASCCICLARYVDNDELRELPCCHFFHTECVDKWLKINASCPLCKSEIGEGNGNSTFAAESSQ